MATSVQPTTRFTPFCLMFGQQAASQLMLYISAPVVESSPSTYASKLKKLLTIVQQSS